VELPCSAAGPFRALRPERARQPAGELAPERRGPLPQAEYGSVARRVAPQAAQPAPPQAALPRALPLLAGAQSQPGPPQASQRRDALQPDGLPAEPLI
jgi:hypothetical protein